MDILVNTPVLPSDAERAKAKLAREANRNEYYKGIEPKIGKEATAALKRYCDMFDDELYIWFANLWEPEIGGFYFSNSARDTVGFGPDLESTVQILRDLHGLGLMPTGYDKEIPLEMREKLLNYARSLQDENGYFYHPQWGKKINSSRRGRDLNWAVSMFEEFGATPFYKTPLEITEESSSTLPPYLKDTNAYKSFLSGLDIHSNSYFVGNTIGSLLNEIEAAGKDYIDITIKWMNEMQIKETGFFQNDLTDTSANGFMKLAGIYYRFKADIPNLEKAFANIINIVFDGNMRAHVCSSYNPWCSFDFIIDSVKRQNNTELLTKIRTILLEKAPSLIDYTRKKIELHIIGDGSFSYHVGVGSKMSQFSLISLGTLEGDVNATSICTHGILRQICTDLDIPLMPLYCEEDKKIFLDLISKIEKPKKINPAPIELYDTDAAYLLACENGFVGSKKEWLGETEI